jgi:hypothetical protein
MFTLPILYTINSWLVTLLQFNDAHTQVPDILPSVTLWNSALCPVFIHISYEPVIKSWRPHRICPYTTLTVYYISYKTLKQMM